VGAFAAKAGGAVAAGVLNAGAAPRHSVEPVLQSVDGRAGEGVDQSGGHSCQDRYQQVAPGL
jgi:hypothetical protein